MDVTPRELRDIEIREGFRGYNRDDVDELLERAAATIESLNERIRQLTERLGAAEKAPAPVAAATPAPAATSDGTIERALILAQRAADEAVAEAQAKARGILEDADGRARAAVADAEGQARRIADTERRRVETEVRDLGARREALIADVESLERFDTDYRSRLRQAIEGDLDKLDSRPAVAPAARPTLHDVEMPGTSTVPADTRAGAPVAPMPAAGPPPAPAPTPAPPTPASASPGHPPSAARVPEPSGPPAAPGPGGGPVTAEFAAPGRVSTAVVSPLAPVPGVPPVPPEPTRGLFDAEPELPETLDDESFFRSLREAVSDTSPLGPRDQPTGASEVSEEEHSGGLFRRHR